MTADEPSLFENLAPYMQTRLMLASAVIFRESRMQAWTHGHEKLVGVILWNYETRREKAFKYSRVLKRYAYGRTQNYKLLKPIVDQKILISQGNGRYAFSPEYQELIEQIFTRMKDIDLLKIKEDKAWEDTGTA